MFTFSRHAIKIKKRMGQTTIVIILHTYPRLATRSIIQHHWRRNLIQNHSWLLEASPEIRRKLASNGNY